VGVSFGAFTMEHQTIVTIAIEHDFFANYLSYIFASCLVSYFSRQIFDFSFIKTSFST